MMQMPTHTCNQLRLADVGIAPYGALSVKGA